MNNFDQNDRYNSDTNNVNVQPMMLVTSLCSFFIIDKLVHPQTAEQHQ